MSDISRKRKRWQAKQEFFERQMKELERKNIEMAEKKKNNSNITPPQRDTSANKLDRDNLEYDGSDVYEQKEDDSRTKRILDVENERSDFPDSPERPQLPSGVATSKHVAWTSNSRTSRFGDRDKDVNVTSTSPSRFRSMSDSHDDRSAATKVSSARNDTSPVGTSTSSNVKETGTVVGSSKQQDSSEEDPDDPFGGFSLLKRFRQRKVEVPKPSLSSPLSTSVATKVSFGKPTNDQVNEGSTFRIEVDSTKRSSPATSKGDGIRTTKRGSVLQFSDDEQDLGRVRSTRISISNIPVCSTPVSQENSVGDVIGTNATKASSNGDESRIRKSLSTAEEGHNNDHAGNDDEKESKTIMTATNKESASEGSGDEFVFRRRRSESSNRAITETKRKGNTQRYESSDSEMDSSVETEQPIPICERRRNPLTLERETNKQDLAAIRSSPLKPQRGSDNDKWNDDDGFLSDCDVVPAAGESSKRIQGNRNRKNTVDSDMAVRKRASSKKIDRHQRHDSNDEEDDRRGGIIVRSSEPYDREIDESDCRPDALKPVLNDPQFGPDVPMQPLLLTDAEGNQQAVPASLNRYLAPFQKEGVRFMYNCLARGSGVILGDEMGCGKTVQVIALLCALFDKTGTGKDLLEMKQRNRLVRDRIVALQKLQDDALRQGEVVEEDNVEWARTLGLSRWHPVMIVVPPTIVDSWRKSFDLFTHFSVAVYSSSNKAESVNAMKYGGCDVLLVPKSLFASETHFQDLNTLNWKLIIIDEFHNYKGMKTKLSNHLRELKTQHRPLVIGMTGTLMQNNHKELWNLCDLVETNYLGTWDHFNRDVDRAISLGRQKGADQEAIRRSENASRALRESLSKIMIERKKEDVLGDQLPEKNEQVIFCELAPLQKEVYKHVVQLPDFDLVKKGNAPCDCGINMHIFKKFLRLSSKAEQLEYYRTNKNQVTKQSKCCRRIPLNPRKDDPDEPMIDPDAAIWRTLDAHNTGESSPILGCKQCPWCCTFPCLKKLVKLSSHLGLIQAQKTSETENRGSPAHVKYTKEREFAKVALVSVVKRLPGGDFDRSDSIMDDHFSLSGKLRVLDRLLVKYYKEGGRVLLFAHSTQLLDLIEHWLKSRGTIEYRRMDGQTASSKRQGLADEYNRDSSIFLFLLSMKATGLGLTLTGANRVIIFDVDWNPSWEEQAQDRAHRIGQKRNVNVVRLISKGTVEELTYLRQIYKTHLKQDTLQDSNESHAAAPRVFRGVQGDKHRKGELFGTENLFRFKDGSFLDDIWAQLDGVDSSKSDDLKIHQSVNLSKALLGIGQDFEYERKLDENEGIAVLRATSERVVGENQDTLIEKAEAKEIGSNTPDANKDRGNDPLESHVRAVNHGDLFRSDRGGAAIPSEAEGYDEEMGGATQDMYAVFKNADVSDSDVHGSDDCDEGKEGEKASPSTIVPDVSRSSRVGHHQQSGAEVTVVNPASPRKPKPFTPSVEDEGFELSNSCINDKDRPPISHSKPADDMSSSHENRFSPDRVTKKLNLSSADTARNQEKNKFKLVGISNIETAKTQFSTADLLLPSYKKKKKKLRKKDS